MTHGEVPKIYLQVVKSKNDLIIIYKNYSNIFIKKVGNSKILGQTHGSRFCLIFFKRRNRVVPSKKESANSEIIESVK